MYSISIATHHRVRLMSSKDCNICIAVLAAVNGYLHHVHDREQIDTFLAKLQSRKHLPSAGSKSSALGGDRQSNMHSVGKEQGAPAIASMRHISNSYTARMTLPLN